MVKTMETELKVTATLLLVLVLIMGFPNTSLSDQGKECGRNCFLRTTVTPTEYSKDGYETGLNSELEWGYGCDGGMGPSEWGNLSPKWYLCGNGTQQSPIRILTFDVFKNPWLNELQMEYHLGPATISSDGNIVRLRWNGGVLYIEGRRYELYETQFHSPSEHTINGKIYPLEMQMVHKDTSNGSLAILSVLFRFHREDNEFLDQFWPYISSLKENHTANIEGGVNPRELHLKGKHYYRYKGSLTSPPCTEGVVWTVVKKEQLTAAESKRFEGLLIYKVSPQQVDLFYAALKHQNSRPIQHLNGRIVYKAK